MSDDLEAVLRRVAAGELSPEQALSALGESPRAAAAPAPSDPASNDPASNDPASTGPAAPAADAATQTPIYGTPARPPSAGWAPTGSTPTAGSARSTGSALSELPPTTVRLKTSYRSIQVITDPAVARIHVSGDHTVRKEGAVLVISTSGPLDDEHPAGDGATGRFSFSDVPRTFAWARAWRDHQLIVRMNPDLALDLDVIGTDVKITGPVRALKAHAVASSVRAERLHGQIELEAFSSSIKLRGAPTESSRIQAESSSVRLSLTGEADLQISARNRMGKLSLLDQPTGTLAFEGETNEVTVGAGRHRLSLELVMSSVTVTSRAWESVA